MRPYVTGQSEKKKKNMKVVAGNVFNIEKRHHNHNLLFWTLSNKLNKLYIFVILKSGIIISGANAFWPKNMDRSQSKAVL